VDTRQPRVGIVTAPIGKAGLTPLSNLVDIVQSLAASTHVISGFAGSDLEKGKFKSTYFVEIPYKYKSNLYLRAFFHLLTQIRISLEIIRFRNKVDSWIYFLNSQALLLPVLTTKLLGKRIIFALAASIAKSDKVHSDALNKVLIYSEAFNNKLADKIVVYSPHIVRQWSLEKYKNKIVVAHEHYLDFDKFKVSTPPNNRNNVIGYVGRFSEEKGILNFARSIPIVIKERNELNFLIAGDGQLRIILERDLNENHLNARVKLSGWIAHDELPRIFNELKLIVLPSYTEGLPNIMLEAMACGTPVLATSVGAIPDFIEDGSTGFIMENNSPECIANNILRALSHPNLEQIALSGRKLVEKEFTRENARAKFNEVLKQS
jgi:glycosyltransferase involved in cell wall biosynthesis